MLEAATPAHAAPMALLHRRAFPPAERWDAGAFAGQLGLPGTFGWISPEGGMVLARVAADDSEILTLAVDPSCRRRGLGRLLMQQAMRTAAGRGAKVMFLEVADSNQPACALYAAIGFAEAGRRAAYYPGGGSALVLRAAISAG